MFNSVLLNFSRVGIKKLYQQKKKILPLSDKKFTDHITGTILLDPVFCPLTLGTHHPHYP